MTSYVVGVLRPTYNSHIHYRKFYMKFRWVRGPQLDLGLLFTVNNILLRLFLKLSFGKLVVSLHLPDRGLVGNCVRGKEGK